MVQFIEALTRNNALLDLVISNHAVLITNVHITHLGVAGIITGFHSMLAVSNKHILERKNTNREQIFQDEGCPSSLRLGGDIGINEYNRKGNYSKRQTSLQSIFPWGRSLERQK